MKDSVVYYGNKVKQDYKGKYVKLLLHIYVDLNLLF